MSFFARAVTDSVGAMLIGVLISVPLWGVSCAQVWHYYQTYPRDSKRLKLLVAVVFAFDTLHQCLINHAIYTYVISHFTDPLFLIQETVWSVLLEIPIQAVVSLLVQTFFAYRILKLSGGSYVLFCIVMVLSLAETGALIGVTIQVYRTPGNWIARSQAIRALEPAGCALACAADMVIAGVLIVLLGKGKSHYQQTNSVIAKLMAIILSTGLLTTCCAIIMLITYFVLPNALVYLACYFILGRLYTNSFLVQLNMRYTMRQQLSATPTALMASVPPMHSSLGPQPHLHLPAPSNSQSQSQSYLQSSTYSYPNSKPSANIPSGSQSGSNPYAHPVYAPEHYPADMHMRAGNQEPAGAKFRDAKHLAPPDPFQTFASSSTSHSYSNPSAPAPTPEAEHIRPLPAPPNPAPRRSYVRPSLFADHPYRMGADLYSQTYASVRRL